MPRTPWAEWRRGTVEHVEPCALRICCNFRSCASPTLHSVGRDHVHNFHDHLTASSNVRDKDTVCTEQFAEPHCILAHRFDASDGCLVVCGLHWATSQDKKSIQDAGLTSQISGPSSPPPPTATTFTGRSIIQPDYPSSLRPLVDIDIIRPWLSLQGRGRPSIPTTPLFCRNRENHDGTVDQVSSWPSALAGWCSWSGMR